MLPSSIDRTSPPRITAVTPPDKPAQVNSTDNNAPPKLQSKMPQQHFLDLEKFQEKRVKPLKESTQELTLRDKRVLVFDDTCQQIVQKGGQIREQARSNHTRWASSPAPKTLFNESVASDIPGVIVVVGDCLDVARWLTGLSQGEPATVLNMANANGPGGGYRSGAGAQEENTIRRTDWYTSAKRSELLTSEHGELIADKAGDGFCYTPETTQRINCQYTHTCLDSDHPLVCFKGSEASDYQNLREEEYFFFYELRAALENLNPRYGEKSVNEQAGIKVDVKKRIHVLLNTLTFHGQKNVVLSAWGCGAFGHSAQVVAELFKEALQENHKNFDRVVFAIFMDEGQTTDPRMKRYMDLSKQNLFDFHSQFHSQTAEILHIGAAGISQGKKLIAPDVTKTKWAVCAQFNREQDAQHFVSALELKPMRDKKRSVYLPLIDIIRNPGKFTVRIPITIKSDNQQWIPFYEPLREKHPEIDFLPKLEEIQDNAPVNIQAISTQQSQQKDLLLQQMAKLICLHHFPDESPIHVSLLPVVKSSSSIVEYTLQVKFANNDKAAQHRALLLKKDYKIDRTWLATDKIGISDPAALNQFLVSCNANILFEEYIRPNYQ